MSEETKTTTTEQPTTPTPEDKGGQGEKMFTQDEVNRIVSERLARERAKAEPKEDERETALREREKALEARESKYKCADYLKEINVAAECADDLMEALDTADFDKFKAVMGKLGKYFVVRTTEHGAPPPANPPTFYKSGDEEIARAFKPKI
ncbi:hypothetical protein [uncultured Dysosmobacter sp.]|uniref:hypothetical protein n=1 Tax=uncultured Dysosmobacter sp. TaxID=2591384 RepID=UPI0026056410|nr:hypothetical protein [uncultured Dysosmobacter sp.]